MESKFNGITLTVDGYISGETNLSFSFLACLYEYECTGRAVALPLASGFVLALVVVVVLAKC